MSGRRIAGWLSLGLVAGAAMLASPGGIATASADPIVDVRIEPPAPRNEAPPPPPSPHHFWIHGYWQYNGHQHVWVPGRYEQERPGWAYREGRWEGGRGHWHYVEGGWYRR